MSDAAMQMVGLGTMCLAAGIGIGVFVMRVAFEGGDSGDGAEREGAEG